ncbi:hypothetical protein CYLTODRAFT_334581, partial [Cylindrobasidium torrendii FP15055 ss-10]
LREAIVQSSAKTPDGRAHNWHQHVPLAVFADRVTTSHVHGYSPYYLLHGIEPLLPLDLMEATFLVEGFHPGMSKSDLLTLRIRQLQRHEEDLSAAASKLQKSRIKNREQFLQRFKHKVQHHIYNEGQLVLVRNSALEMHITQFKATDRYSGPYEIVKRTTRNNYVLKEMDGTVRAMPVAAFRVIPY